MSKSKRRKLKKPGLPPETLVYTGDSKVQDTKITVFDYDETRLHESTAASCDDCFPYRDTPSVTWINVDGLHDVSQISKIGAHFDIHPLTLEDILNTNQRPKIDEHDKYIYIVLKMLSFNDERHEVIAEQISFILTSNNIISFQEDIGDVFDPIRDRIRTGKGKLRRLGPDYLLYSLLDCVVDNYFVVLEKFAEKIELLEDSVLLNPKPEIAREIHNLKRETILLRKSVWPLREVLNALDRADSDLIKESTEVYLRDLYDHTIQVIDSLESYRDILGGMLEIYLASVSNRMNEIMKVLTIISTIFIPLTFIVGVYGMNFDFMPELHMRHGYSLTWLLMLSIAFVMLIFFRRRGWL